MLKFLKKTDLTPLTVGIFLSGLFLGVLIGKFTVRTDIKPIEISYVSQEEIYRLENERISELSLPSRELFLGKVKEAVKLIDRQIEQLKKQGEIILLASGSVAGANVKSISKDIYLCVIEQMIKDNIATGDNSQNIIPSDFTEEDMENNIFFNTNRINNSQSK